MDGGHQSLDDAEIVVDDLGQGGEAVGGARSIRNLTRGWRR